MIINQINLDAAFTGFKLLFQDAFQRTPVTWDKVATQVPSSTSKEVYPWLGNTTKFRQWLGDRDIQSLGTHGFTITNLHFEDTVSINRDAFEDDSYGIYSPMIAQLGEDSRIHPDLLVWGLIKNGQTGLCYDGQPFFSAAHPNYDINGNPTTVSNIDAGGNGPWWYLFDVSRAVKPVIFQKRKDYQFVPLTQPDSPDVFKRNEFIYGVDARVNAGYGLWQLAYASNQPLDTTHYQAARAAMQAYRVENGDVMAVTPGLLAVPPVLEGAARTILKADTIAQTTNIWKSSADLLVVPRLQ